MISDMDKQDKRWNSDETVTEETPSTALVDLPEFAAT